VMLRETLSLFRCAAGLTGAAARSGLDGAGHLIAHNGARRRGVYS
jgi:hypothetical protein